MTRARIAWVVFVAGLAMTSAAVACAPAQGATVAGPVLEVPAAGVICVALGPRPEQWVRVRLAGGEDLTRNRLMAATFAKRVACVLGPGERWTCRLGDSDLVALAGSPSNGLLAASWR